MRAALLSCGLACLAANAIAADMPAPVEMTAEEDHKRMMGKLGIGAIRQGANGRDPNAPNAANYDESKANPYPDAAGSIEAREWQAGEERQGLVEEAAPRTGGMFDREIYGRMPENMPAVKWEVKSRRRENVAGGSVAIRKLIGHVDNSAYPLITVDIDLTLTTPAGAKAVPVIIEFFPPSAGGAPPGAAGAHLAGAGDRAGLGLRHPVADQHPGRQRRRAHARASSASSTRASRALPDDWGALRAWAWGAARALDYLETDPDVDAKRVGIEGVSRYRQGGAGHDGLRAALRHRLHRLLGRGRRGAASPAISASSSRTSPAAASITGWRATTSSTPPIR